MTIDKAELRALAEAATKAVGPYRVETDYNGVHQVIGDGSWKILNAWHTPDGKGRQNAEFFAAANPATVLGLLDEIERHEKNGDALMYKAGMENVAKQRDQLKAENEALRSQVAKLQAEPNSYQSGFDAGRAAEKAHADNWRREAEGLRKDAERYRAVRRVANRQGYSDEQFDQQTDDRTSRFDAAVAKEAGQ